MFYLILHLLYKQLVVNSYFDFFMMLLILCFRNYVLSMLV